MWLLGLLLAVAVVGGVATLPWWGPRPSDLQEWEWPLDAPYHGGRSHPGRWFLGGAAAVGLFWVAVPIVVGWLF